MYICICDAPSYAYLCVSVPLIGTYTHMVFNI